jgi:hypothetical protein
LLFYFRDWATVTIVYTHSFGIRREQVTNATIGATGKHTVVQLPIIEVEGVAMFT